MSLMYCPICKSQTEVKVTGASSQPKKEKRLFYKRTRTCQKCNNQIYTVEIEEKLFNKYSELKKVMIDIYRSTSSFMTLQDRLAIKKLKERK